MLGGLCCVWPMMWWVLGVPGLVDWVLGLVVDSVVVWWGGVGWVGLGCGWLAEGGAHKAPKCNFAQPQKNNNSFEQITEEFVV